MGEFGIRCRWYENDPDLDCENPADIDCKYCTSHQAQADTINRFLWSVMRP